MKASLMRKSTLAVVTLAMLVALLFLGIDRSTASANEGGTLVRLSAPELSLETDAHGTVQYFRSVLKFDVRDIPCPGALPNPLEFDARISFALYAVGADLDYTRLATFVPLCSWNITSGVEGDTGGQGFYQGVVRTDGQIDFGEVVDPVFEVWVEFDDGFDTPVSLVPQTLCNEFCRLLTSSP